MGAVFPTQTTVVATLFSLKVFSRIKFGTKKDSKHALATASAVMSCTRWLLIQILWLHHWSCKAFHVAPSVCSFSACKTFHIFPSVCSCSILCQRQLYWMGHQNPVFPILIALCFLLCLPDGSECSWIWLLSYISLLVHSWPPTSGWNSTICSVHSRVSCQWSQMVCCYITTYLKFGGTTLLHSCLILMVLGSLLV